MRWPRGLQPPEALPRTALPLAILTVLMVALGPVLDRHRTVLGLTFILWGALWTVTAFSLSRSRVYLGRASQQRLRFRRWFSLWPKDRRMSDDDWLERDIRSHHTVLLYVMVPTGPLMVLAGVLVFIHAILG